MIINLKDGDGDGGVRLCSPAVTEWQAPLRLVLCGLYKPIAFLFLFFSWFIDMVIDVLDLVSYVLMRCC